MKLQKYTPSYVKYRHNNEEIDIPEYKYVEENVRGVWIANVANMDTPICENVDEYKQYLISILDNMKSFNMNTAIFHVRPTNDSYYKSSLNPWSKFITGTEGKDPGFDVLEFFIKEASRRNIRVHAWFNPYRVNTVSVDKLGLTKDEYLDTLSENNWARLNKEHTILDGVNKIILRPGHQEVIDFVTKSVIEVAEKYDIDAIHMDDFFYPYDPVKDEDEYDDYIKFRKNEQQTLKEWRLENVDKLIEQIHNELTTLYNKTGKYVEFGISPFPIYRTHKSILDTGWEKGSYHSKGAFQCYEGQYSDIYKWMVNGWIDYVVPQDYFSFERPDVSYHDICWWWANICRETNTKLYIGQAIYHLGEKEGRYHETWQNPEEINNQLKFNCNFDNIKGTIFFTYKYFIKGDNQILNEGLEKLKKLWNNK